MIVRSQFFLRMCVMLHSMLSIDGWCPELAYCTMKQTYCSVPSRNEMSCLEADISQPAISLARRVFGSDLLNLLSVCYKHKYISPLVSCLDFETVLDGRDFMPRHTAYASNRDLRPTPPCRDPSSS
jgi:hypothetical protein